MTDDRSVKAQSHEIQKIAHEIINEGWWLDIGASHHVCHDLSLFRKYNEVKDKNILLGDHHTTKVVDIGEVEMKFTSSKALVLKEVLHTSKI
ncbi:retrovirus-related pol polyprotein from transposon tnt 1-94 [Cucumis melo var. makuwa]|uniref:Retrovirus-related pol polyprotein from transposon tnt 1-94 n=1 Tax=Cucumis melo var. makuwa TaxID=1194695 RepID=A0A5D3BDI7_CUCMM|nr:retrovirus-related pol polyprotein from transposon tnt 1-94 [Cucumis melo var. makuwa]